MKNIFYTFVLIFTILIMKKAFLTTTDFEGLHPYAGQRANTKVVLSISMVDTQVELPRFPADVLVYSPVKLIPFVDMNILEKEETIRQHQAYISKAISEEYSLAYCYLRVLEEYGITMPVAFNSKDINYNISAYTDKEVTQFSLGTFQLDKLNQKDMKSLLSAMKTQTQRDTVKISTPINNCIVEVTDGTRTRYLWVYYVSNDCMYVVDPCEPQLNYARIENNQYLVGTKVFRVNGLLRKMKSPVQGSDGSDNNV